ncbi:hypothetical protein LNQ03_33275 [Klebsiella pneumoniae subsp. pneumoniae]|nr:hypothetical protein [Klebsiella pneumoniae subsp. pneumoniae]
MTTEAGETSPGDWPLCLVANEQYHQFRALLVHADPDGDTLTLSARELDMLEVSCRRPGAHGAPDP